MTLVLNAQLTNRTQISKFKITVKEVLKMKIEKLLDKVDLSNAVKAECCCHDCATWIWTGKSCSRVKGCYEKCRWTSKTTTLW